MRRISLTLILATALFMFESVLPFDGTMADNLRWGRVQKIIDGDTILLEDGRLIRYIGIDAPEIDHKQHVAEPFGFKAQKVNARLVGDGRVRLEMGKIPEDRYDRCLAFVYAQNGRMINLELIGRGMAYYYPHPPNESPYDDHFLSAQRQAMLQRIGIWELLPVMKGHIAANCRSMRFHAMSCPYARRIKSRNRVTLGSLWDAFWNGYAPCTRCLPSIWKIRPQSSNPSLK